MTRYPQTVTNPRTGRDETHFLPLDSYGYIAPWHIPSADCGCNPEKSHMGSVETYKHTDVDA